MSTYALGRPSLCTQMYAFGRPPLGAYVLYGEHQIAFFAIFSYILFLPLHFWGNKSFCEQNLFFSFLQLWFLNIVQSYQSFFRKVCYRLTYVYGCTNGTNNLGPIGFQLETKKLCTKLYFQFLFVFLYNNRWYIPLFCYPLLIHLNPS